MSKRYTTFEKNYENNNDSDIYFNWNYWEGTSCD